MFAGSKSITLSSIPGRRERFSSTRLAKCPFLMKSPTPLLTPKQLSRLRTRREVSVFLRNHSRVSGMSHLTSLKRRVLRFGSRGPVGCGNVKLAVPAWKRRNSRLGGNASSVLWKMAPLRSRLRRLGILLDSKLRRWDRGASPYQSSRSSSRLGIVCDCQTCSYLSVIHGYKN